MSKYIPKVGDRICDKSWPARNYVDVKAVGEIMLFGVHDSGAEGTWCLDGEWIEWTEVEVPAPLPELWITQFTRGVSIHMDDPARRFPGSGEVLIASTRLIPDGNGYRVEVERHA